MALVDVDAAALDRHRTVLASVANEAENLKIDLTGRIDRLRDAAAAQVRRAEWEFARARDDERYGDDPDAARCAVVAAQRRLDAAGARERRLEDEVAKLRTAIVQLVKVVESVALADLVLTQRRHLLSEYGVDAVSEAAAAMPAAGAGAPASEVAGAVAAVAEAVTMVAGVHAVAGVVSAVASVAAQSLGIPTPG